jgi:hypothetical protein
MFELSPDKRLLVMPSKNDQKVLFITILDGDGSESEPIMKAVKELELDKEYFIFLSNKPYGFESREEFEATMKVAMKALMPKPKPPTESANVANPLFESKETEAE